jgi:hypothetical protein
MTQAIAQGTRFFEQFGRIDHILREGPPEAMAATLEGCFTLKGKVQNDIPPLADGTALSEPRRTEVLKEK